MKNLEKYVCFILNIKNTKFGSLRNTMFGSLRNTIFITFPCYYGLHLRTNCDVNYIINGKYHKIIQGRHIIWLYSGYRTGLAPPRSMDRTQLGSLSAWNLFLYFKNYDIWSLWNTMFGSLRNKMFGSLRNTILLHSLVIMASIWEQTVVLTIL